MQELADALEIELTEKASRPRRASGRPAQAAPEDGDPVLLPRPHENPVIAALRERGLYKSPIGGGWHDITCPWHTQHTDAVDDGTRYAEPSDNHPVGGFKCHHSHGGDLHIRDLLDHLGIEAALARMKPTIRMVAGKLPRVVDAAERELAARGRYYQSGGAITEIVTDRSTRETRIQHISQPALTYALGLASSWERYDARAKDWVRTDPPERHVAILHSASSYAYLPVLNGLARQPYLRDDNTLITQAGYDRESGMYGVFDAQAFSVPDAPSMDDARASLALLQKLLTEVAFRDETDRAATLSAMLTAVVRPSLPSAPMFHVRAHAPGSGKSFLCEIIAAFASPQSLNLTTFPSKDEECAKHLLAELMHSPAVIAYDNLTGDLVAHKSLCTVLTAERFSQRVLGVSKNATVGTRTLFLSNGNNVVPVADMTRRVVTINLAPAEEIPAMRTFQRPDLLGDLRRERARYVAAALTVVRAWQAAGSPQAGGQALAGFGRWTELCRQPLLWLGLPDPVASIREAITEDPDRQRLEALLTAWFACFERRATKVREATSIFGGKPAEADLLEILLEIADERGGVNPEVLGKWIKRHKRQRANGLQFVEAEKAQGVARWRVEKIN